MATKVFVATKMATKVFVATSEFGAEDADFLDLGESDDDQPGAARTPATARTPGAARTTAAHTMAPRLSTSSTWASHMMNSRGTTAARTPAARTAAAVALRAGAFISFRKLREDKSSHQ